MCGEINARRSCTLPHSGSGHLVPNASLLPAFCSPEILLCVRKSRASVAAVSRCGRATRIVRDGASLSSALHRCRIGILLGHSLVCLWLDLEYEGYYVLVVFNECGEWQRKPVEISHDK
nr:hypothetical protein CFP56_04316 [Quercus suber]